MKICQEMQNLRNKLNTLGIQWTDYSDRNYITYPICRTRFKINGFEYSVINGFGTYGGINVLTRRNQGLLEIMSDNINGGEPVGWLTATEVMEMLKDEFETFGKEI